MIRLIGGLALLAVTAMGVGDVWAARLNQPTSATPAAGLRVGLNALLSEHVYLAAAATNDILTATAGPNTTTITPALNGTLATGGVAVLIPLYGPWTGGRNVVVTVTHASAVVAVSGVITGTDIYGRTIAEAWAVTAGTTSKTYTGTKAFKVVTSVTITAAADASADTVVVGDGNQLGLDVRASAGQGISAGLVGLALKEMLNATLVTTGTITPFDPTNSGWSTAFTADPRGTFLPASVPDGSRKYELWFLSDDPEYSDTGKVAGTG